MWNNEKQKKDREKKEKRNRNEGRNDGKKEIKKVRKKRKKARKQASQNKKTKKKKTIKQTTNEQMTRMDTGAKWHNNKTFCSCGCLCYFLPVSNAKAKYSVAAIIFTFVFELLSIGVLTL